MKTVFNQKNTLYKENQDKINHKINKRFREFKYFFNRYIDPDEEKECVVCKSKNLTKFINQFRHFFFWDKRLDNDDMHYYCDIQFKLHEEYLLICDPLKGKIAIALFFDFLFM